MSAVVAVTGGSGFIGRALEARLRGRTRLRGLFRTPSPIAEAWRERGHEVVFGDVDNEAALARLVEGAEAVYHLAARTRKDDPEASRRVNVDGTARVARVSGAAGAGRLVYVSSISVYAATEAPDGTVTEELEPQHIERLNPYSASKYEGERAVREAAGRGAGPPFTIVRPTNVYGPWGRSWFLDWAERLRRFPLAIGGGLSVDLVHVDDVADALARAGEAPVAAGEVLHVGGEPVVLADYLAGVGEAVGVRVRRLPAALDAVARHTIEGAHRILKGERMSTPLTRSVRYPHDKARRLIGYEPRVSLEEGLAGMKRWYREICAVGGGAGVSLDPS